ncbi:MAG TPA: pyruvoyl-dependent arginine decarboxylase [Candidatus Nanoarchaeia archaeon]|nr:pyruvoyl-dependent arginine decarboxylase [Candidatus Nanoarchaeia archaeon]
MNKAVTANLLQSKRGAELVIGTRIPKDYFVTSGSGESDITIHAGSYHLALKDAGIERCNIMTYSSILPAIANRIERNSSELTHGAVMETITACSNCEKGKRATAGIIVGWLYNKMTGKKYGGLVCEYNGDFTEEETKKSLGMSLNELYINGFDEEFELRDIEVYTKSMVPKKKFGTALVALCFVNYVYPVLGYSK